MKLFVKGVVRSTMGRVPEMDTHGARNTSMTTKRSLNTQYYDAMFVKKHSEDDTPPEFTMCVTHTRRNDATLRQITEGV